MNPLDLLKQKTLSNIQSTAQRLFNGASSFIQQNPTPAVYANQQFQQKVAQPLVNNVVKPYVQNQIIEPIKQAIPSAVQAIPPVQLYRQATKTFNPEPLKLLGGVGGIVSASPAGIGYNVAQGVATGIAQSIREKTPVVPNITKSVTQPTSFAQTGLGVQNPVLAGIIDIASPIAAERSIAGIANLKKVSTLDQLVKEAKALGIDGISPNAFKMDNATNNEALSLVKSFRENGVLSNQEWKDLNRIFERFISKKAVNELSVAGKIRALDYITNKNLGFDTFKPPTMGIVGDKPLRKQLGSYTNVPEIDNPLLKSNNFEKEMDQLSKSTAVDLSNIKNGVTLQEKAVRVSSDIARKDTASLKGGSAGTPSNDVLDAFSNWVNSRKSSKIEGIVKGNEFNDLNSKGIQGIFDFQKGDVQGNRLGYDPRFREVKKYFDQKYQLLKDTGIDFNYKQDYLPQLWNNSPDQVQETFRRLGLKPSFSIEAVFKNYQEGIAAGLSPKFNNIGDLVTWYEQRANKAIADRQFFEFMGKQGMILPNAEAPRDWVSLNPDRFPKITMKTDMGVFTGEYKAPQGIATMINNYLGDGGDNWIKKVADFASSVKNRVLSAGIPYTGWNAHGYNILVRNTLAEKNPVTGLLRAGKWLTKPNLAEDFINTNLKDAAYGVKHGLTFNVEDHVFKRLAEEPQGILQNIDKVRADKYAKWFEDPLFQKALPALKLNYFKQILDDFRKTMPEELAAKRAANTANDIFGGINWEQWGRSRENQNILRAFLLAPDWLESTGRIAKGILDVKNPAGKAYRRILGNFLLTYAASNILNKHLSGHYMFENDSGNWMNLDTGTYTNDGKRRYMRPYGTAADFIRIPIEIALGLTKGDLSPVANTILNRTSMPVAAGVRLGITKKDYYGKQIYGKDQYGNEVPPLQAAGNVFSEVGQLFAPSQIKAFYDLVSGRNNLEQTVSQALELPVRYKGFNLSPTKKELQDVAKSEGMKGESLFKFNQKVSQESAFSEKQRAKAKIGGTQYINSVYDDRKQKKAIQEYKDALSAGEQEKAKSILDTLFKPESTAGAAEPRVSQLTPDEQKNKLMKDTQEELAKAKVEVQGGVEETADKYFYMTDKGTVTSVDKTKPIEKPTLTGKPELDKKLIAQYKTDISSQENDIIKLYQLGKIRKEEAEKMINKLRQDAKQSFAPRASSGKKAKIQFPKYKFQKGITLSKPKKIKLYKPKFKKLKAR